MATSKTLAPTNVTISIPAMTDAPNASVISNCLDKEADAINALNSQIDAIQTGSQTGISATTVPSGTWTTIQTITGITGVYAIEVDAAFGDNTSGIRILMVDTQETNTNGPGNSVLASGRASLQKVRFYTLVSTDKIYIRAYQNSGGDISVNGSYRLLRLK